jgi:UDP-4-amino-4,6-dideoxy-N-acetyl-beta-L-altrosamine N-acetyltransferase
MNLRKNIELDDILLVNFVNLNDDDKEMIRNWRNHEDVRKWMYSNHLISTEEHAMFMAGVINDNKNSYWLARNKNGECIGVISLNRLDFNNENAYFGIYANPDCKMQGVGHTLIDCLKKLAFHTANLHTLKLEVIEANEQAVNFYERSGFSREGRLKECILKGGKRQDVLVMGIMRDNNANPYRE